MKTKLSAILISTVLLLGLQSTSLAGEAGDVNLNAHYGEIIDNLVAKCKFKTQMRYSKSEVIRKAAMLSCLKTTFYNKNREALIRGMIGDNIGLKRYKAEYYLNTQFYNLVRPHRQMVAKSYLSN